jgi:hypothetical protein
VKRSGLLFAAALVVLLASCGGDDKSSSGDKASSADRCRNVPKSLVDAIEAGLTVTGGGTLTNVKAVKSTDFKRVYFISADIEGSGMEEPNSDDIGTWVKSGPLRVGGGLILAVDATANEFSDWGDGRKTDAQLSMEDEGAEESKDCVKDAQR